MFSSGAVQTSSCCSVSYATSARARWLSEALGGQEAGSGLTKRKKSANPLSVAFRDIAGCCRDSAS